MTLKDIRRVRRRGPMPGEARVQKRKRQKAKPITEKPPLSQYFDALNLTQLAWVLGQALKTAFTIYQIAGCIAALKLRNNDTRNTVHIRGTVISRQQTAVTVSELAKMQTYLKGKYNL